MLFLLPTLTLTALVGASEAPPTAPFSLAAELAATAPAPVSAPQETVPPWDFSYTFVELGAARDDLDAVGESADRYYGKASLGLLDVLYFFLGYENSDFGIGDTDLWRLGAGVHLDVLDNLDLTGDLAWLRSDTSGSFLSKTSDGYELRLGARWMALPFSGGGFELEGHGLWIDLDDSFFSDNSVVGFDVGARLHFIKILSVGAYYTKLGDDDSAAINARVSF